MAAAVAQYAIGRTSGGTSVSTSSDPKNTTASGRTFLIIASDAGAMNTPTDNKGNTYVACGSGNNNAGNLIRAWICVNGTGGGGHYASATLTSTGFPVFIFLEISGALTSGAHDTGAYAQGGDDATPYTLTTSGANLAQADNLVIGAFTHNSSGTTTSTVGSPFTMVAQEMDTNSWWPLAVAARNTSANTSVSVSFERTNPGMQTGLLLIVIKSSAAGNVVEADATISAGSDDAFTSAKLLAGVGALPMEEAGAWGGAKLLGVDWSADGALSEAFVATAVAASVAALTAASSDAFVSGTIKSAVWAATADIQASFESNAIASSEADFTIDAAADVLFDGGAVASAAAAIDAAIDVAALSSPIVSAAFDMEGAWDAQGLGSLVLSGVASAVLQLVFEAGGELVEIPGGGGALTPAALLRIMRRPAGNRTMNRPAGSRLMRRTG